MRFYYRTYDCERECSVEKIYNINIDKEYYSNNLDKAIYRLDTLYNRVQEHGLGGEVIGFKISQFDYEVLWVYIEGGFDNMPYARLPLEQFRGINLLIGHTEKIEAVFKPKTTLIMRELVDLVNS